MTRLAANASRDDEFCNALADEQDGRLANVRLAQEFECCIQLMADRTLLLPSRTERELEHVRVKREGFAYRQGQGN